jgi:hypothetical protein
VVSRAMKAASCDALIDTTRDARANRQRAAIFFTNSG